MTRLRPLGRVVPAEEARLYADAAAARAASAAEQAAQRAAMAQECARLRAAAEQEAETAKARMLAEASAAIRNELAGLRREIAEAIAEGVAKVIGGMDLAEAVARAARRAIAELEDRHVVVLRVAPEAAPGVRSRIGALARVEADAGLAPDDCVLETPAGFVKAGLARQLAILREALREAADRVP